MSKSCSRKVNKTRYDNLRKPMKQTSFTVKVYMYQKYLHVSKVSTYYDDFRYKKITLTHTQS